MIVTEVQNKACFALRYINMSWGHERTPISLKLKYKTKLV
jgi:hypothetical protein